MPTTFNAGPGLGRLSDVTIVHGDCLEAMAEMEADSIDAIVTDPPYGLEFMGKEWDSPWKQKANDWGRAGDTEPWKVRPKGGTDPFQADRPRFHAGLPFQLWCEEWTRECLRVLKPGGHLLAFGGTRTWHRLAVAVEDAGFEIRDSIAWLYGSGFPKSLDVSKAIYKAAGAEQWQGWGTALKPAFEPIVVARKPIVGTVAANVLQHGTGALNIDGCRVETTDNLNGGRYSNHGLGEADGSAYGSGINLRTPGGYEQPTGRWPANVVLDADQAAALDEQSGKIPPSSRKAKGGGCAKPGRLDGHLKGVGSQIGDEWGYTDSGGASRFFYCAKAPKKERPVVDGIAHSTVKPLTLMRWLVRLVTPPGGTVLDPFAGSGTTVEAALLEGFKVIGIEMAVEHPEYLLMIQQRIARCLSS